jgi:hypothetical protein
LFTAQGSPCRELLIADCRLIIVDCRLVSRPIHRAFPESTIPNQQSPIIKVGREGDATSL